MDTCDTFCIVANNRRSGEEGSRSFKSTSLRQPVLRIAGLSPTAAENCLIRVASVAADGHPATQHSAFLPPAIDGNHSASCSCSKCFFHAWPSITQSLADLAHFSMARKCGRRKFVEHIRIDESDQPLQTRDNVLEHRARLRAYFVAMRLALPARR